MDLLPGKMEEDGTKHELETCSVKQPLACVEAGQIAETLWASTTISDVPRRRGVERSMWLRFLTDWNSINRSLNLDFLWHVTSSLLLWWLWIQQCLQVSYSCRNVHEPLKVRAVCTPTFLLCCSKGLLIPQGEQCVFCICILSWATCMNTVT